MPSLPDPKIPQQLAEQFADLKTFKVLEAVLAELERPPAEGSAADPAIAPAVASVRAKVQALNIGDDFQGAVRTALRARVPQFFYFSDYDFIGGRTDLRRVYTTPPDQLEPPERTALSLLRLAGADNAAMLNEDYESRKAELEAVSNELTGEMTEYWSQSKDLEVVIDVDKETEQQPTGPTAVGPVSRGAGQRPSARAHRQHRQALERVPLVLLLPGRVQRIPGTR